MSRSPGTGRVRTPIIAGDLDPYPGSDDDMTKPDHVLITLSFVKSP